MSDNGDSASRTGQNEHGSHTSDDVSKPAATLKGEVESELTEQEANIESSTDRLQESSAEPPTKRFRKDDADGADSSSLCSIDARFEELCAALSRNDASITTLENYAGNGYAQPLGHALQRNTHVSSLKLCLLFPLPREFKDGTCKSADDIKNYVVPLVQALESSTSLREVKVTDRHDNEDMDAVLLELLVGACLRNPNLEKLTIYRGYERTLPATSFRHGQSWKATSLKSLVIDFPQYNIYSEQDRQVIGDAFQYLPALTQLRTMTNDSILSESILAGLLRRGGETASLNELELTCDDRVCTPGLWLVLSALLHAQATTVKKQLQHLTIGCISFRQESMEGLVNALKWPAGHCASSNGGGVGTSVSELEFSCCSCDDDAKTVFLDFMQTRVGPSFGVAGIVSSSSSFALLPRELEINDSEFGSRFLTATELIEMLCVGVDHEDDEARDATDEHADTLYPTVGSCIESFISHLGDHSEFLTLLAEHARRIRLAKLTLQLDWPGPAEILALHDCVAHVCSLREFHVYGSVRSAGARSLVSVLKENGNLISVSVDGDVDTRRVQAYCDRNQFLDPLLLEATTLDEDNNVSETAPLSPALLQTAQQIPRTRASGLLRSFMSLDESIGYP